MFYIVETQEQLNDFNKKGYKEAYIEVIPYSYKTHPTITNVSLVYIRPFTSTKGYIMTVDHSEGLPLNSDLIGESIGKFDKLYVWGKKEFMHFYWQFKEAIDLSLLAPDYEKLSTPTHKILEQRNKNKQDINRIIPLVKHYESCEENYNNLKKYKDAQVNKFYNNTVPLVFKFIEQNGIRVDSQLFEDYFDCNSQNRIYTQYNLNTTTTRPSNKFGGINFAALNKENGCRKAFIPENDKFLEMDISAYHPTLAARLVGYEFDEEDIHESFAKMYKVDYKKSKELTFKQLYGGVFKQYKDLEFFVKIQKYVDELWEKYNSEGFIECPISNHRFEKDKLDDMNPQKLFNYLLQNLETSLNVRILKQIIEKIMNAQTKLVLYTFDAFLFDLDNSEEIIIEDIKNIFKEYGLKVKIKHGTSYDFE